MTDSDWRDDARRRAMRCNAEVWLRPNPQQWIRPDADRFMPPGWREDEARAAAIACGRAERPSSTTISKSVPTSDGPRFTEAERRLLLNMLDDWRAIQANLATIRRNILSVKEGFKEDQPRWPKGTPNSVGGRWSGGAGTGGAAKPSADANVAVATEQSTKDQRLRITIRPRGIGDNGGPPLQEPMPPPPEIPENRPTTPVLRNRIAKEVAKWALRAVLRLPAGPVGTAVFVLETAWWLYESYPYIKSYLDEPKTLGGLQQAVYDPQKGYDVHHIAEQDAAEKAGFPQNMIEGGDNLVRIPTFKHHQITGWYMTPNDAFKGQTPREYLKDKSWAERVRVGHDALRKFGVLKP